MPAGGGKGEEADVPGGMPPAAPALLPLCRLGGWTSGSGGDGTLKRLAIRLATKWKQSYSKMCVYVNSRIAITLVLTTHLVADDFGAKYEKMSDAVHLINALKNITTWKQIGQANYAVESI